MTSTTPIRHVKWNSQILSSKQKANCDRLAEIRPIFRLMFINFVVNIIGCVNLEKSQPVVVFKYIWKSYLLCVRREKCVIEFFLDSYYLGKSKDWFYYFDFGLCERLFCWGLGHYFACIWNKLTIAIMDFTAYKVYTYYVLLPDENLW